jgi:hypothetical protein
LAVDIDLRQPCLLEHYSSASAEFADHKTEIRVVVDQQHRIRITMQSRSERSSDKANPGANCGS